MGMAKIWGKIIPGRGNIPRARIRRQKQVCHIRETARRPAWLKQSERVVGAGVREVMGQPCRALENVVESLD